MGLNVEDWRLLSKYAFLFSKKDGRGGLTSPHPPGAVLLFFVQACFKTIYIAWARGGQQK